MADFHRAFTQSVQAIHDQIEALAAPNQDLAERKAQTDAALASVTKLAASLSDASSSLPAYDQRSYQQSLRQLQDKLAISQASHAPKPKFSFQNKRLATPASEATSTTTSRSVTPTHLQNANDVVASQATPVHVSPPQPLTNADNEPTPYTSNTNTIQISDLSSAVKRWPDEASNLTQAQQPNLSCTISNISTSIVHLRPEPSAGLPLLTITDATNSLILAACIKGPAWMNGVKHSTLVLSCHQFRMHDSHNVNVYLHCSSRPIIEDCTDIKFLPIPSMFQTSQIPERANLYDQVDDFKWLRAEHSPNWSLGERAISEEKWKMLDGEQESTGVLGEFLPDESLGSPASTV